MNELFFWIAATAAVYSYFIYPIVLSLLPSRRHTAKLGGFEARPPITIIIAAHNEGSRIRAKIENTLALAPYGGDVQIIIASDASKDETDAIVTSFAEKGVELVRNPVRQGKEAAQRLAIEKAVGDIIVFTDVATSLSDNVLHRISVHFENRRIGAISSTDKLLDKDGRPSGEGAYVRYEMWLRRQESRVGSLIGLSGSFFAARADVCRLDWRDDIPSDFLTAINCAKGGRIATAAEDVIGYYEDLRDSKDEYKRKYRTVLRGINALAKSREMLGIRKYGLFSFQLWSHKVFRWLTPVFCCVVFILNISLLGDGQIYWYTFAVQVAFYLLAIAGAVEASLRNRWIFGIPYFFCLTNLAIMEAMFNFLRGESISLWTPSRR